MGKRTQSRHHERLTSYINMVSVLQASSVAYKDKTCPHCGAYPGRFCKSRRMHESRIRLGAIETGQEFEFKVRTTR